MKSVLVLLFLSVQILSAACPASTVQITGTLLNPDGSGFTGRLIPFLGYTIPTARENRVTITVTAGVMTASNNGGLVCLAPASYTVANYVGNSQLSYSTYWVVPSSGPVGVVAIESTFVPTPSLFVAPSSITPGTNGQVLTTVLGAAAWAAAAGGGGAWGSITGTLSNQLDLASALAAKQASLGYVPANVASNLSDLTNTVTARTNLGLGAAAVLPGSTTVNGTVCTLGSTCTPPTAASSGVSGAIQSSDGAGAFTGAAVAPTFAGQTPHSFAIGASPLNVTDFDLNFLFRTQLDSVTAGGPKSFYGTSNYSTLDGSGNYDLSYAVAEYSEIDVNTTGTVTDNYWGPVASSAFAYNAFSPAVSQLTARTTSIESDTGTVGAVHGDWVQIDVEGGTIQNAYAFYAGRPTRSGGGTYGTYHGVWIGDGGGAGITNSYYSWFDSRGVRRVKEDATFNSVGQAIEALYNPQFTKYTPGATDFERIVLGQFNSNVAEIGTEASGTGVQRDLRLLAPTVRVPGALIVTGAITGALTGNASTSTALAANPADCASARYTTAIAANGDLTCGQVAYSEVSGTPTLATVATSGSASDLGTGTLPNARIVSLPNANLANSSITVASTSPLTGGASTALGGTVTLACATCGVTGTALSQFAATTSAQLAGVLSDESGTGLALFQTNATLITPTIASFVNATHTHANAAGGGTIAYTDLTSKPSIPTVTGGTCTSQAVTAISGSAVPTCTTITSAYVDSSIAPTASPTFTGTVAAAAVTETGRYINSLNGAVSAPPVSMTGTWFVTGGTATTTKPQVLIECNSGTTTSTGWATAGTGLGVNACTGFTGRLLDLQVNGSSAFSVTSGGNLTGGTASLNIASANYFTDSANTKGYFDTTISGFNWINENRVNGNVSFAVRAKASQSADLLDFLAAGGTTVLTKVDVTGVITAAGYKSSDGTAGATTTCTIVGLTSITVKNGLITGCS